MYMDCVLKSEEYSSWGMDHLHQVGTGYSGLDVSQENTYLYFGGLFTLAMQLPLSLVLVVVYFDFVIGFSVTIQGTLTDRLN